jgi:hypothetical protein
MEMLGKSGRRKEVVAWNVQKREKEVVFSL